MKTIDTYIWAETLNRHVMMKYLISFDETKDGEIQVSVSYETGEKVNKQDQSKAMKEFIDGRARLFRMRKK